MSLSFVQAAMTDTYCHSCYRSVPDGRLCPSCESQHAPFRSISRVPLVLGSVALPLLLNGMGALNTRLCMAGTAIATAAVLAHVWIVLRNS